MEKHKDSIFLIVMIILVSVGVAFGVTHIGTVRNVPNKKVLIAYFSQEDCVDFVVDNIQWKTNGDVFEIKTETKYPRAFSVTAWKEQISREKGNNFRPKIIDKVENFENYEVIFLGYPRWDNTIPMVVASFLESYNFSGKIIIPFCVYDYREGNSFGNSLTDIAKLVPTAEVSTAGFTLTWGSASSTRHDIAGKMKRIENNFPVVIGQVEIGKEKRLARK